MTNFNPEGNFKDIQEWEAIAEHNAGKAGISAKVIGGILAGAIGMVMGVELLGGVVGAWLLKSAWDGVGKIGKKLALVRDMGCNAWVLCEPDFRTYVRQFGDETVASELSFAQEMGVEISNFAYSWLKVYQNGNKLPQAQEIRKVEPVINSNGYSTQALVKTNATSTIVDTHTEESEEIDIVAKMTDHIQNIFGVGQGGSGKGMLLANALRAVKQKHPGKKIFLINGKDDSKEYGYFDGVVDVEKRMHCETAKPQSVAAWFESSLEAYEQFALLNGGGLLVIDEGTIIGARLKDAKSNALNDKIVGISSCGGSFGEHGKHIWIFAQTPFAGGSGSNLTALSQMTSLILVKGTGIGVLEQWKRSSLFRKFDSAEVGELANKSECNRVIYWGGTAKWYSMPKLINHSIFCRDTGELIGSVPVERLNQILDISDTTEDDLLPELTDCIIDKIASAEGLISFEGIRSHIRRKFPQMIKTSLIESVLSDLINQELIKGGKDIGYTST